MTSKRIHIGVLGLTPAQRDEKLDELLKLANYNRDNYYTERSFYSARGAFGGKPKKLVAAREDPCPHCAAPEPEEPKGPSARDLRIARRRREAYGI